MKKLKGFLIGFISATFIFVCISVKADNDPKVVGDSGYLYGLELVDKGYGVVCDTLYYDKDEKQIVCK
jgi:hypothetical protein